MSDLKHCRVPYLGSGRPAISAAVYAARRINPVLVTGIEQGGQLMTTTDVADGPATWRACRGRT